MHKYSVLILHFDYLFSFLVLIFDSLFSFISLLSVLLLSRASLLWRRITPTSAEVAAAAEGPNVPSLSAASA